MQETKEEFDAITVQGAKGRSGDLDPKTAEVTATIYETYVRVRIDSAEDPHFWMEFTVPLEGTPAALTPPAEPAKD